MAKGYGFVTRLNSPLDLELIMALPGHSGSDGAQLQGISILGNEEVLSLRILFMPR